MLCPLVTRVCLLRLYLSVCVLFITLDIGLKNDLIINASWLTKNYDNTVGTWKLHILIDAIMWTDLFGVCGPKAFDVHVVLIDRGQVEDGEGDGEVQINHPKQFSTALPIRQS